MQETFDAIADGREEVRPMDEVFADLSDNT